MWIFPSTVSWLYLYISYLHCMIDPGDDLDEKQLAFKNVNPVSPVSCNVYDFEPIKGKTTPV